MTETESQRQREREIVCVLCNFKSFNVIRVNDKTGRTTHLVQCVSNVFKLVPDAVEGVLYSTAELWAPIAY